MNEQDLKRAFEDVVVASSPPPSMDPGSALDVARKARSKRRSSMVGAAVAVLVVGVGLGSAFALNPKAAEEYMMGVGPSSSSNSSSASKSDNPWPDGQTDRTAYNGPQAERGVQLLNVLKASVPAGYDAPALKYGEPEYQNGDMQRTQAQIASNRGEQEVWEYLAHTPVRKDGKVGVLLAEVSTPNAKLPTEPCALAKSFWGMSKASCKVVDVGGKQVGVASLATPDRGLSTWASYRAANGWTVTIAQGASYAGGGYPALAAEPFLTPQLAALAADPKFLVGS
jgi:hypothetical protein